MKRWIPLLVLGLLVCAGSASGQSHKVGKLWYSDGNSLGEIWYNPLAVWPGGLQEDRTNPDIGYRVSNADFAVVSLIQDYNAPSYFLSDPALQNTTIAKWVNDVTDDLADFTSLFPFGTGSRIGPKFFRVQPPTLLQDGQEVLRTDWRVFADRGDAVRPELTADEMIERIEVRSDGLRVRKQTYAWANREADDFVIEVVTITYPRVPMVIDTRVGERGAAENPEIAQKNPSLRLHIGYNYFFQRGGRGPSAGAHITINPEDGGRIYDAGLGELGEWDEVNYYDDREKLVYAHDGDAADRDGYRVDGDDRGEPAPGPGELLDRVREALVGPGEFLESEYKGRLFLHVDKTPTDGPDLLGENWLDDANEPDPDRRQPRLMRWVRGENWLSSDNADRATVYDFYVRPETAREERIEVSDPDKPGWTQPRSQIWQWMTTFGPWELEVGQSIHIVSALIVNGPSIEENKRMGKLYLEGKLSFAEKEAFLDSGFDSLMASVNVARQAWADRAGIAPKLDPVPAWPSRFEVKSGPDRNELTWAPVAGAVKYRVYRMEGFETRPPARVAEVTEAGYNDEAVIRGVRYFYSVTSVDAAGGESSLFATRTTGDGVSPFRSPEVDITKVRVVPNPYQIQGGALIDGGFNFTGQPNKLLFVNLPARARIRIFTISGDLVTLIEHTSGSGDEEWPLMISDNNQFISSGMYLAHIEDMDTGATHIARFIVVR